jgi:hypothetical protein
MMALLAGVAFIGAAAHAEAASTTPPLVLDSVALDSVTAGNFGVGVQVFGSSVGVGPGRSLADVQFFVDGQANETGGTALGVIGALGFGPGGAAADTDVATQGNITFEREFHKSFNGILEFSAKVGWAASSEPLQVPAAAQQVLGLNRPR